MVRKGLTEKMTCDGERASVQLFGRRAFWTRGTAITDALVTGSAWCVPGTERRLVSWGEEG